eukprot:m.26257 g.26257  ORF g.26257 m.26257 type:complete len:168 (-) comp15333_c0_seq1:231-734(-)
MASALLLSRQLKDLKKNPVEGFSAGLANEDDIYKWDIMVMGPPDTIFEGGYFKAQLTFPTEYPVKPPKLVFQSKMWHPNVYKSGEVCISILHEPGEDKHGYEDAGERWNPTQTVTTIMLSVISMLCDPNDMSPANVDAAKEWRENRAGFESRVRQCVRQSEKDLMDE